ncbi:putative RNA-directed DNA polymerase, eukaryota, reverse transcriptase zinc-binding domain protein [Tanacetum coccineum]
MKLNFEGQPMQLLAVMLPQVQEGEGVGVVAQAVPPPIPEPMPEPDQPQDHLSTPPRQQTSDPFTSTNVEDEPLGGSFHASPPRSTQAPPAGHTSGGAEDLTTLTDVSSVVSTLVQKVNSLETELKDTKKLFKDVVGKLVKKVKAMECGVNLGFVFCRGVGERERDGTMNSEVGCLGEKVRLSNGSKKKLLIFKVDFEKAFDSLSRKYLDFVLLNLGFSSKWRSWIRACLSSSRASVLVNGGHNSEFSIKRGLRQGDPLSPFLFILVMDGLHNALSTAVSSGLIRGVKFGSPELTISHLFYADDMIITTKWNANELDNYIRVLQVFYLASSLKINIHKSNVYGIGVLDVDVSSMASNSGCVS